MKPKPFFNFSNIKIGEKVICLEKGAYGKVATVVEIKVIKIPDYFDPYRMLTKTYIIVKWEEESNFKTQFRLTASLAPFDSETHLYMLDQQKREEYANKYL